MLFDRQRRRDFKHVVGAAGVSAGIGGDLAQRIVLGFEMKVAETALCVLERAPQQEHDLLFRQRIQHVHAAARQQRRDDLERRVLRGGADQANASLLDVGQKSVLLRLVEAMYFVHEDDGARAVLPRALRVGHDLLDFLDAGQHGREFDEVGVGHARDDLGQRRLANAGRSPEDERAGVVALDLHPQRLAGREDVLLADKLVKRARTHAIGQRPRLVDGVVGLRDLLEEVHGIIFITRRHREEFRPENISPILGLTRHPAPPSQSEKRF